MSLKKFISGASALAVAATAFAAMAVTASAKDYGPTDVTPGTLVNVKDNNNGTYKQTSAVAGVIADISGLTDIDLATSVTVEFDTYVLGSSTALAQIMYGVGDKKVRGLNGKGSSSSGYKTEGLVTAFGSMDGSTYVMKDVQGSYNAAQAYSKAVHAVVTLDRANDRYTATISYNGSTLGTKTAATTVDNITVIEAFTWGNATTTPYNITFKNIKVSYTVPYPEVGALQVVEVTDNVDGDDVYAKAYTADITYNGIAIENVKVEVPGSKEVSRTRSFEGGISGDVRIGIILASDDESKIADVIPKVTVNAE